MKKDILSQVYQHPLISADDLRRIVDAHHPRSFTKGELIYARGKVLNEYMVLESGLIRSFTHNYKGDEITTDFFGQHEVVIEVLSLFQRTPLQEDLHALTDGYGWVIPYATFQELYHTIPGFSEWGRLWMTNKLFQFKQKSIDIITQSAKKRYLDILANKPQIIRHAPLKQIASFLGITDTSLSRIRKDIG